VSIDALIYTNDILEEIFVAKSASPSGYHVETGNFTTMMSVEQIAVSGPRGQNHLGFIQFFTAVFTASSGSLTPLRNSLSGDEPDGYFGYDFASVDFNTGGYSSLVVGCPLCNRDRGRVYIYVHTADPSNPFGDPICLPSPSLMSGRFGTAVENIGDVDLDGYSDVAISAPFEGSGVVYIFRGSSSGLVPDTYQVGWCHVISLSVWLSAGFPFTIDSLYFWNRESKPVLGQMCLATPSLEAWTLTTMDTLI